MTETEKYERLTNGAVKPLIVSLAVPTIFTMLISSFYNMADAMFVGTIDPAGFRGDQRCVLLYGDRSGVRFFLRARIRKLHFPHAGR